MAQPQLLWVTTVGGFLGVLAYSNRPWGLKYRILGDVVVFLLSGPLLTTGVSLAVFSQTDPAILVLGLYLGFISLSVLHSGNFQDIDLDSVRNLKTLANQLGFRRSRNLFPILYGSACFSLAGGVLLGWVPSLLMLQLSVVPLILYSFLTRVYQASGPASALLAGLRRHSLRIHLQLGVLMILALMGVLIRSR
jgi:1,4-dihydroxy-2-naphthoate octaprenyltransferase